MPAQYRCIRRRQQRAVLGRNPIQKNHLRSLIVPPLVFQGVVVGHRVPAPVGARRDELAADPAPVRRGAVDTRALAAGHVVAPRDLVRDRLAPRAGLAARRDEPQGVHLRLSRLEREPRAGLARVGVPVVEAWSMI